MYVVSKATFSSVPPVTLALLRLLLGGLALALFLGVTRVARPGRAEAGRLAVLGVTLALTLATQFLGTDLANAQQGALLTTTTPAFVGFFAWRLAGEPLTRQVVGGTLLALFGVVVVVLGGERFDDLLVGGSVPGNLLLLLSAAGWALYTVLGKSLVRAYGPLPATAMSALAGLPFLAGLTTVEVVWRGAPHLEPVALPAVLYLGLASTALAWWLWYKGMETLDASVVGVFFFAQPIVGGLLAWLVLGEPLSAVFLTGGAIILAGIYVVTRE
ncbi:MAG: DMT family transporter [Chloroflexi bacterium]|nr:DMT family transporter [Chloroflexota bacterium]